ncbi:hypothetical protein HDU87_004410 [Geranomyces variabilis]|uniref:Peptidase A1 domain-containing protein n=1 Tax=Geranomyces variabilis TaxID=109894 RepID=A0AAD5XQ17_9FUNG|nr:hypothetical protein HDU87_004410 [Geranomyces variabilis]
MHYQLILSSAISLAGLSGVLAVPPSTSAATAVAPSALAQLGTNVHHIAVQKLPAKKPHPRKPLPGRERAVFSPVSNGAYYGMVSVGTPAQQFPVLLDTGSADFWIYAERNKKPVDKSDTLYRPFASSTNKDIHKNSTISYGDGSTSSYAWMTDTVAVGDKRVKSLQIGAAYIDENGVARRSDVTYANTGLLGLSWQDGNTGGFMPAVQTMFAEGAIPRNMFALYLGNERNSTDGALTLGGLDPSRFMAKDFAWNPSPYLFNNATLGQQYFNIDVDQISITKGSSSQVIKTKRSDGHGRGGDREYILDSGTSFFALPTSLVNMLVGATNATLVQDATLVSGGYAVDCKQRKIGPKLSFTIGGKAYDFAPSEWIGEDPTQVEVPGTTCFLELYDIGDSTPFILGDTFLRKYYSVYDFENRRTGLAQALHG